MIDFVLIDDTNLASYETLLPRELMDEVLQGTLVAFGGQLLGYPVAALTLEAAGEACRLRSFYVTQYGRRRGLGSQLLDKLEEHLRQIPGIYLLTTMVPDSEGAAEFLTHCGFTLKPHGAATITLCLGDLEHAEHIPAKGLRKLPNGGCLSYDKLPKPMLQQYENQLKAEGEYFPERPMQDAAMLQNVSHFCVEGDKVTGCMLFSQSDDGICLEFMHTAGGSAFLALLSCAVEELRNSFPPETKITFEAVSEIADKLTKRILPGIPHRQAVMATKCI